MNKPAFCWILDSVEDDFQTVWELISVLQPVASTMQQDVIVLLGDNLNILLAKGFIGTYEGSTFTGEQKLIENFIIDDSFIEIHKFDWKTKKEGDVDYRFLITKTGLDYYNNNCKKEHFNIG